MMRRLALALTLGLLLTQSTPAPGDMPEALQVSAIPDENPNELLRIYTPFAEYLSRELGLKVQFTPVIDYAATVEGLAARKLDLVWYGGFTSVQAVRRTNGTARRLALRQEDAEFKSVFVAGPGSGKKRDVRRITIGRPCSRCTSSHTFSAATLVTQ